MTTNYLATAYPSNLIKFSAVGHFLSPEKQHLLAVKARNLELHALEDEELVELSQVRIPRNLLGLWSFRPKMHSKDLVVLLTRQYELFVIELEQDLAGKVKIHTKFQGKYPSSGDITRLDGGPLAMLHAENRLICLAIFAQRLEIIDLCDMKHPKSFPIRCPGPDGVRITAMEFLNDGATIDTTSAFLQTTHRGPLLSFCNLNTRTKEKEKPLATFNKLDFEADLLLTVPGSRAVPSGVLVVGNSSVQYFNTAKQSARAVSPFLSSMAITAHCVLHREPSGSIVTYLLGGADGRLILVVVRLNDGPVDEISIPKKPPCRINVEFIGVTSAAQTLSVLAPGIVFLGTCAGPGSLLLKLRDETKNPLTGYYYDVLQTFPALGSILELHVAKSSEKSGLDQSSLLACIADTFGNSLTVVRSGINLQDPVEIALPGIQAAWHVSQAGKAGTDGPRFILSDFSTTRCCHLEGDDLRELDAVGNLELKNRTLLFQEVSETTCLQVTTEKVILLSRPDFKQIATWEVPELRISCASFIRGTLAVASGALVHLLDISPENLLAGEILPFNNELCALEVFADSGGSLFLAAGEWITWNVSIVEVSTGAILHENLHPSDIQPRSLTFCRFSNELTFLFCGRGDGNVDYFLFNEETKKMEAGRHIPLGTRLVTFTAFRAQGQVNVFACSDRPCVVSCRNGKLLFSNVNIPDAVAVCPVVAAGDTGLDVTDDLLVVTAGSLLIGHLEDIQKIHFIPLPLGFQVFRLAFQPGGATIAVIGDKKDTRVNKFSIHKSPDCTDDRALYILDRHSFHVIASFQCPESVEILTCLCYWSPGGKDFLILGTERDLPKENHGSLIVLELINDRLQVIHTYATTFEPIRNVAAYGEFLLATTDNALLVFEWLGHQLDLPRRLETPGSLNLHLDLLGNTVLVGDFQKCLILAEFNPTLREFEVSARDLTQLNFLSLMIRDKDTVLGGDDQGNLLVLGVPKDSPESRDVKALACLSWISVGDPITSIRRGSLVSPESIGDVSVVIRDSFVYGTCKGQLGVIFELEEPLFKLLQHIEKHLLATTWLLGTADPANSLRFTSRLMDGRHTGFVDGDLIETALTLRVADLKEILTTFSPSSGPADIAADLEANALFQYQDVDFVWKILDDLVRLH